MQYAYNNFSRVLEVFRDFSEKTSVSLFLHTNNRLNGTHCALSPELGEGQKTHSEFGAWSRTLRNRIWPVGEISLVIINLVWKVHSRPCYVPTKGAVFSISLETFNLARRRSVQAEIGFSPPRHRAIFSTFWGDFLTNLHIKPGEINPLEKTKIQWRSFPEIADFCPCRGRTCPGAWKFQSRNEVLNFVNLWAICRVHSNHLQSVFYETLPSKNPSKNHIFTESPYRCLLRTLLRSTYFWRTF